MDAHSGSENLVAWRNFIDELPTIQFNLITNVEQLVTLGKYMNSLGSLHMRIMQSECDSRGRNVIVEEEHALPRCPVYGKYDGDRFESI